MSVQTIFEDFRQNLSTDQLKAGAIQSFEFCFELSWKTLKKILQKKGIEANSPRDIFRLAAKEKMISDAKKWFVFLEKRNHTVHCYDESIREDVILIFDVFSDCLADLISNIRMQQ